MHNGKKTAPSNKYHNDHRALLRHVKHSRVTTAHSTRSRATVNVHYQGVHVNDNTQVDAYGTDVANNVFSQMVGNTTQDVIKTLQLVAITRTHTTTLWYLPEKICTMVQQLLVDTPQGQQASPPNGETTMRQQQQEYKNNQYQCDQACGQ